MHQSGPFSIDPPKPARVLTAPHLERQFDTAKRLATISTNMVIVRTSGACENVPLESRGKRDLKVCKEAKPVLQCCRQDGGKPRFTAGFATDSE